MRVQMGTRELELGGPYLGAMRDANALRDDPEALRRRMAEDGYLLIRGLHDPSKVRQARASILDNLRGNGQIDTGHPLDAAVIPLEHGRGAFLGGARAVTHSPEFLAVVEAPELMRFFGGFLAGPVMTYSFKWLRAVGHAEFTGAHYDVVYMGRGTKNLYTCWSPFGDVPYELGPLAILEGGHLLERLKGTYGNLDVDRDLVAEGWFTKDPVEMVDTFGGRWLTTEFEVGDAVIFGMYCMHASLNNASNRYRVSCDTRFQRLDEPYDERWAGEHPVGHYAWNKGDMIPMAEARRRWGI
jgi:hypothetical protein